MSNSFTNETFFDPVKDTFYQLIVQYFSNPILTKIKDVGNYSMYVVQIQAVLDLEYKYLIVFVMKDEKQIGVKRLLNQLQWTSFQTRTLKEKHTVVIHSYNSRRFQPLNKPITLVKKTQELYVYSVKDYPISITLLGNEHSDIDSLLMALEKYQTILTMI